MKALFHNISANAANQEDGALRLSLSMHHRRHLCCALSAAIESCICCCASQLFLCCECQKHMQRGRWARCKVTHSMTMFIWLKQWLHLKLLSTIQNLSNQLRMLASFSKE